MTAPGTRSVMLAALVAGLGCGEEQVPASMFGAALFDNPKLSTSPFNAYACSTCHDVSSAASPEGDRVPSRIDPGYNLRNAVHRPSWWGGERTRLLDAINYCLLEFMGGRELEADEPQARQLYEFLAANSPDAPSPALPITVVKNITSLTELPADPARGKALWDVSCGRCHGEPHTAKGALTGRAGVVPELTINFFKERAREAVIEKVRHGKFFHIGGIMPLYSRETLRDEDLVHILAYLGL